MLQRYVIHFALIFLFAFTQIGVVTHEISHVTDAASHTQQEQLQQEQKSPTKHTAAEQCEQCIHYAKVANGLALSSFTIPVIGPDVVATVSYSSSFQSLFSSAYSARAPPQITSI